MHRFACSVTPFFSSVGHLKGPLRAILDRPDLSFCYDGLTRAEPLPQGYYSRFDSFAQHGRGWRISSSLISALLAVTFSKVKVQWSNGMGFSKKLLYLACFMKHEQGFIYGLNTAPKIMFFGNDLCILAHLSTVNPRFTFSCRPKIYMRYMRTTLRMNRELGKSGEKIEKDK